MHLIKKNISGRGEEGSPINCVLGDPIPIDFFV